MQYDFDRVIERHASDSLKWNRYGEDVLPMWVADMDFVCPAPILENLHKRVAHGVFGYGLPIAELAEVLCERMFQRYTWQVTPDQILFLPGLVCGLNLLCRAVGQPGDEVLVQTPVYPPFLSAPTNQGRRLHSVELAALCRGDKLYYFIDFSTFAAAITKRTSLFLLCHPHNPVGRIYNVDELMRLAEICESHNITICSDEIHCDLLLDSVSHKPIASLSPEIANRCITLMAPSKTFNIPGLGVSFAIAQNPNLMKQIKRAAEGIIAPVNVLGFVAALAAYRYCDGWLKELLTYLRANRDYLASYLQKHLPEIRSTFPQATYLAWLDCHQTGIKDNPQHFFLNKAKVALNDGLTFGPGGEGFVRLNFGCPRSILEQGLERIRKALKS
jgi:cystathionine beta-lyase